ncbi:YbfB/YjiJ family MFS transporter [Caballeronia sp. LZ043]|uniref:YbfB/YjiJ family MFS transporter n=1 Tax=Caballeronia sp. LZ043 TaxID=3038569 RepID=UPI0028646A01|nr:YbfB/YjiJ family MFS transporter [Caballeronia sp. LZ043]MDR5822775.1 YbfB/YjiJ family MFS transporter [Caballeronia sp. LZ043]
MSQRNDARDEEREVERVQALKLAIALSLGSAIALGLARFSYALLLPPMRQDLAWNFAQAGAMNTANAFGYLLGALAFSRWSTRFTSRSLFVAGCIATVVLMAASGAVTGTRALLALRVATGIGSALIFVSGGVLAARLASLSPRDAGLIIGIYYGGTGWGIVISSILVPFTVLPTLHGWRYAWFALAVGCAVFSVVAASAARRIDSAQSASTARHATHAAQSAPVQRRRFALALSGYACFGIGYIGYMTFIVALLRNAGMSAPVVSSFYVLLGVATVFSARMWSTLLDRMRGGQALAILNALLAVATLVPAMIVHPLAAFVSGALFGATFLSAVASTTAFVRHNLPSAQWARGINAFTIVFAFGQIVGPVVIGKISDSAGLTRGLVYSALVLVVGAVLAALQKPLDGR